MVFSMCVSTQVQPIYAEGEDTVEEMPTETEPETPVEPEQPVEEPSEPEEPAEAPQEEEQQDDQQQEESSEQQDQDQEKEEESSKKKAKKKNGEYEETTVAIIDDDDEEEFDSLQKAIDAAEEGKTVKLIKNTKENITINKSVTIDLGDHTVTGNGGRVFLISSGTVSISNGTITGGVGTFTESDNGAGAGIKIAGGAATLSNLVVSENKGRNGAGIYVEAGSANISNSTISDNSGTNGAGIGVASSATLSGSGLTIISNIASSTGGGVHTAASSNVDLTNCTIENNSSGSGGGGGISSAGFITVTGGSVSNNTTKGNGGGIQSSSSGASYGTFSSTGITMSGNTASRDGYAFYGQGTLSANITGHAYTGTGNAALVKYNGNQGLTLSGSISGNTGFRDIVDAQSTQPFNVEGATISNNTSKRSTIYISGSTVLNVSNSTITDNQATNTDSSTGGIFVNKGTLNLNSGAIYNNITASTQRGNDFFFNPTKYNKIEVNMIPASEMTGASNKMAYVDHNDNSAEQGSISGSIDKVTNYTVEPYSDVDVAEIGDTKYNDLLTAFEDSNDGDTIKLIASDEDGKPVSLGSMPITSEKNVTLDLNDRTVNALSGSNKALITVNNTMDITNDGKINGKITVGDNGDLTVGTGKIDVGSITYKKGSLTLNQETKELDITLGKDQVFTVGDSFKVDTININLDEDVLKELNELTDENIEIEIATGSISGLADKVKVDGIDNPSFSVKEKNGKLYLVNEKLADGIFISGKGDDSNPGTKDKPVKTFEKAKELLDKNSDLSVIYVVDSPVEVTDSETWSLDEGDQFVRYPKYNGKLVNVTGELTLENITIDGSNEYVKDADSMIAVKGTLNVNKGAVLQNNETKDGSSGLGGAICATDKAKVNVSGGTIQNNSAKLGGGIYAGTGSTVTVSSGSITNNNAYSKGDDRASGGGIFIGKDATLTMSGGSIEGNTSEYYGGGVGIGSYWEAQAGGSMTMTGGSFSNNTANSNGGAVFVQVEGTATISAGSFTGNSTTSSFAPFGGGAIYVNGGIASHNDGHLILTNALIKDNTSEGEGAGIAGCATSTTNLFVTNGAAIYNNKDGKYGNSDVMLVDIDHQSGMPGGGAPSKYISEFMLGGEPNNWVRSSDGQKVDPTSLHNDGSIDLHNDVSSSASAESMATVVFTGNSTASRGGAIGSNGKVDIGETENTETSFTVQKVWNDEGYESKRPESITLDVKFGKFSFKDIELNAENNYTVTYDQLVSDIASQSDPKLTVSEVEVDGYALTDSSYVIEGNNVTVTLENTYKTGDLSIKKSVSKGDKKKTFDFLVNLFDADDYELDSEFNYSIVEDDQEVETGTLKSGDTISLTDNQMALIKSLPDGTKYSVEEQKDADYELESSIGTNGIIVFNEVSKAEFTNKKVDEEKPDDKVTPTSLKVNAQKTLDGKDPGKNVYEFVLKDELGNTVQIKHNSGKEIAFDTLTFDKEGTYTYTISETKGSDKKINYSTAVYTLTVDVKKEGNKLVAESSWTLDKKAYNGTPLFENTTKPTKPTNPSSRSNRNGTSTQTNVLMWVGLCAVAAVVLLIVRNRSKKS